jgi:hypothetical protein
MSENEKAVTQRLTQIEKKIRNNIETTRASELTKPSSFIETNVIEGIEEEAKITQDMRNSGI